MRVGVFLNFMKLTILFIFFCSIFFLSSTKAFSAQETLNPADRLIAASFKTLAKVYLTTVNFDRFKEDQIRHLEKMNEEKFQKHFKKVREVLKTIPLGIKQKYGFKDQMTRAQVIQRIDPLDKKTVYQMIDDIPESFIAFQFKQYLHDLKEDVKGSQILRKIQEFWSGITPH